MAVCGVQGSGGSGKAFQLTDDEHSKALGKLRKIVDDYGIPIDEKRQWTVYQAKLTGHLHHSLVFQIDGTRKAFYVHIIVEKEQVVFDIKHLHSPLEFTGLGSVKETAKELLGYALRRARDHGDFYEYSNNCQTYCTNLAVDLGLEGYWTDAGKAGVSVAVVGGIVLILLAIYKFAGDKKKNN